MQTGAELTGDQQAIAAGLQGPADDCIPLGTRFMTQIGDKFPICHTPVVVKKGAVEVSASAQPPALYLERIDPGPASIESQNTSWVCPRVTARH